MLISRMTRYGAAGKKTSAALFLSVLALTAMAGAALAANPGDEVPFKEGDAMPPAPAGMSWCLVQKPAVFDYVDEKVVLRPRTNFQVPVPGEYSTRVEKVPAIPTYRVGNVIPAQLDTKAMSYVSQEGYEALEVVPPEFRDVMEEIEICPAYEQVTIVPAQFRDTTKRVLAEPARKSFEHTPCKGDNLCWTVCETSAKYVDVQTKELIADAREERSTVPAKKQQVMVRKLAKPAQIRKVSIPAVQTAYQTGVVAAPARVEWRAIPAESRNVTVQIETKAPSFTTQTLPEKTENISRRVLVTPEKLVWRLESNSYTVTDSCYSTGTMCTLAQQVPQGTPHACSW